MLIVSSNEANIYFYKKFLYIFFNFFSLLLILDFLIDKKIDNEATFLIDEKIDNIILGHSMSECAYNDSIIYNFKNCSESGESYFYTYFKVKKILECNKSLKRVFIEFTNNQFVSESNDRIYSDKYIEYRYPVYSPFMSIGDNLLLIKNNFTGFLSAFSISLRKNLLRVFTGNYNYNTGGYLRVNKNSIDSLLSNCVITQKAIEGSTTFSEINLAYLHKIVDICQKNKVEVFLIRSPIHKRHFDYYNKTALERFNNLSRTEFPQIDFLDFSKFPLINKEYRDFEHLNYSGANKYSTWFNQLVKKGVLYIPNKQQYIDKKIQELSKFDK